MKAKKSAVLLFLICCFALKTAAQEQSLSGKIRDINTHREIPYVNVFIKGTQIGTTSDFAGRFTLKLHSPQKNAIIVFQHIAYDPREMALDSLQTTTMIYLQPRIIPLQGIEIQVTSQTSAAKRDLPQAIAIRTAGEFEMRGFTDAADLLRTDQSVQVTEELSGKKTVAIRGGNSDEVMVLYNGIKMNSVLDNTFDLALIDLDDVDRFEIIKGSNTAVYGAEALSGIINIMPKIEQDYHIRLQQRFGTYNSGNWGTNLYQKIDHLHAFYSYRQGASKRQFDTATTENAQLENQSTHHSANLVYYLNQNPQGKPKNALSAMFVQSDLDYQNHRDEETLANLNQIVSLAYDGNISTIHNIKLTVSYHQMKEDQQLHYPSQLSQKEIKNRALHLNTEKLWSLQPLELITLYQFEEDHLDYLDYNPETYANTTRQVEPFLRRQHGFGAVAKLHAPSGSALMPYIDFDISLRHDRVADSRDETTPLEASTVSSANFSNHQWQQTTIKFATALNGNYRDLNFNGYMNFGNNVKFPTLFQQVSTPLSTASGATRPQLLPEKNRSMELGFELIRDLHEQPILYGWQLSGNIFKNYYENKFRLSYTPGIPIAFYDNVQTANITGIETKAGIYLLRKKLALEVGHSRYNISEKAAFPFKYDRKTTFEIKIDHAGYSAQIYWFNESEQVGWIRYYNGDFAEIILPGYTNIDIHLGKTFELGKLKLSANASVRNLLNNNLELEGLALRDRRIYMTFAVQY